MCDFCKENKFNRTRNEMERLTNRMDDGTAYIASETGVEGIGYFTTQRRLPEIISRLAHYEDLEEQGRLVVLPCKAGDTIYRCGDPIKKVYEWDIERIEIYVDEVVFIDDSDNAFTAGDIGETVFLTREEAERALEEMKR